MGGCVAFLWACLGVLWASSLPAHTAFSSLTFRKFEGRQITTNIISEATFPKSPRKGRAECSAFCLGTPDCLSFNLGKSAPYRCQLLRFMQGDTVVSNADFDQFISTSAEVRPVQASTSGPWGVWHDWTNCSPGSYMNAYQIKYDSYNGLGLSTDDFGVTHLKMFCIYPNGTTANDMTVGMDDNDPPGAWENLQVCPEGKWLQFWMQSVTPQLGTDDDDALNNIVFYCSSDASGRSDVVGHRLLGTGDGRYSMSEVASCPFSTVVCGLRVKVEVYQRSGDDSAVNHVQFACCFIDL